MGRKALDEERNHINKEKFLALLKLGAVLFVAFTAPGALRIFKNKFEDSPWEEYYPSSVKRTVQKLWRAGYVEIKHAGKDTVVKLTKKGKTEILKYNLDSLEIKKPNSWDNHWRLVIFDIPEEEKVKREIFRDNLKNLGFYQMQESVFIFPYPCEKELQFLREVLEIPHNVKLIRADRIENDKDLRRIFHL